MLKKIGYIFVLFFVIAHGYGQKIMSKSWDASDIKQLEIVSDQVFKVKLVSETSETIRLITRIEGENFENVLVNISEAQQTLVLTTGYTPYFEAANDKLAAHKVISIEMDLYLPSHLAVLVQGSIVSVDAEGSFKQLYLDLDSGNCLLKNFIGNAQLKTKDGNITVYGGKGVFADGNTKRGTLKNELSSPGIFSVKAQSVNGDITLLKSQN